MRRSDVPTPALFTDIDMLTSQRDPTADLSGASHPCGDEAIEIWPIGARYWKTRR